MNGNISLGIEEILKAPIELFTRRWQKKTEQREKAYDEIWRLYIQCSNVGTHPILRTANHFRIIFSPFFYGHGQPRGVGWSPAQMVRRITEILTQYGMEVREIIPPLVRFKRQLENYPWINHQELEIQNRDGFIDECRQFNTDLRTLISLEWRSRLKNPFAFLAYFLLLPLVGAFVSSCIFLVVKFNGLCNWFFANYGEALALAFISVLAFGFIILIVSPYLWKHSK